MPGATEPIAQLGVQGAISLSFALSSMSEESDGPSEWSHMSSHVVVRRKLGVVCEERLQEDTAEEDVVVIKAMCFFRPACVSAEAFALQQKATVGWRG